MRVVTVEEDRKRWDNETGHGGDRLDKMVRETES